MDWRMRQTAPLKPHSGGDKLSPQNLCVENTLKLSSWGWKLNSDHILFFAESSWLPGWNLFSSRIVNDLLYFLLCAKCMGVLQGSFPSHSLLSTERESDNAIWVIVNCMKLIVFICLLLLHSQFSRSTMGSQCIRTAGRSGRFLDRMRHLVNASPLWNIVKPLACRIQHLDTRRHSCAVNISGDCLNLIP